MRYGVIIGVVAAAGIAWWFWLRRKPGYLPGRQPWVGPRADMPEAQSATLETTLFSSAKAEDDWLGSIAASDDRPPRAAGFERLPRTDSSRPIPADLPVSVSDTETSGVTYQ